MYLWVERDNFSMSITMISVNGSSHDPRGMPPFKTSHDDRLFAIFTLCCRFVRKDANHLTTKPGIASSIRLLMTTVLYDLRGQTLLRIQQTWHWQVETGPLTSFVPHYVTYQQGVSCGPTSDGSKLPRGGPARGGRVFHFPLFILVLFFAQIPNLTRNLCQERESLYGVDSQTKGWGTMGHILGNVYVCRTLWAMGLWAAKIGRTWRTCRHCTARGEVVSLLQHYLLN